MSDEPRPMSQEEIDALFAGLGGEVAGKAEASGEAMAEPEAGLRPSEIDEILQEVSEQAVAAPRPRGPSSGPLAPAEIDVSTDEKLSSSARPAPPTPRAPSGAMDQAAIDALLREMHGDPPDEDDDALAPSSATPAEGASRSEAAEPAAAPVRKVAEQALSQSDIDALLSGLDGSEETLVSDLSGDAETAPQRGTESLPGVGPLTATITPTKIERLMAKHEDLTGEESVTGTGVIEQDDVDALLAQMQGGGGTAAPDDAKLGAILKERENDIDALLAEAGQEIQGTAIDAVLPSMASFGGRGGDRGGTAVMTPEEIRGGKYLLLAAVFLLAMCSVTLLLVVSSVNELTGELRTDRNAQETPKDDFDEALAVARTYLADADPDQVVRGITYIRRMKERFRDREDEVTLVLARHYRTKGTHGKAWREYQQIASRSQALVEDPQFYLEYADSLIASGKFSEAEGVLYELIANAAYYAGAGADAATAAEAVTRQAQVMLGRLYTLHLQRETELDVPARGAS